MRISTASAFRQSLENLQSQQTQLAKIQDQIGKGTKISTAAEDPAAMARIMTLDQSLADTARYQSNISQSQQRLGLEENALSSSSDVLQRIRELAVQANSGTQSADSRSAIATELQQRYDELLSHANAQDGEGRYLFAGSDDGGQPFSKVGAGVSYNGDQNGRLIEIGPHRTIADGDNGASVFVNARSGDGTTKVTAAASNTGTAAVSNSRVIDASLWDGGDYTINFNGGNYQVKDSGGAVVAGGAYTSGNGIRFRGVEITVGGAPRDGDQISVGPSRQKDIFSSIQDLITQVQNPAASAADRARVQTSMYGTMNEIDNALGQVSNVRATVGNRLAALDSASASLGQYDVTSRQALSDLRDLDYADAATKLNLHATALQASQQAFMKVQSLSLFDYLR